MSCKIQTALVVLILCGLAVAPPPPSSQRYCSKISPFGGSCNAGYGNGNGNCDYCPGRQKCCLVKTEGDGVNAGLDHCPIGCCIDPPNCWDMNECEGDDGMTVCGGENQICVNTIGSYKCTCTAGFTFDESDSSCKNINECDLTEAVCTGDHEKCVDTDGSYSCDCKDNYRRDVSTDPCLALWVTGSWGTCMATPNCGTGTQTRDVTCPTTPNHDCYGSKPDISQDCCTGITCPAWITSSWSVCPSCGTGVMRERTVSCVGGATLGVLPDGSCNADGTKPTESESCILSACPSWMTGSWGSCTANPNCGTGTQTRTVSCVPGGSGCDEDTKPAVSQECCTGITCPAWVVTWTDCPSCGIDVVQEGIVSCMGGATLAVLDDSQCSGGKPAPTPKACSVSPCGAWKVQVDGTTDSEGWSACTACCGETGKQHRTFHCYGGTNALDDCQCPDTKPALEQACTASPVCTWIATEWGACGVTCGTGSRTRGVSCFDFSCGKQTDEAHCKSTKLDYTEACQPDPPILCDAGDRCASGPCQHCGTCNTDVSHVDGICTCDNGFVGDFCETSGCNDVDLHACVPDGHGCILNKAGNSNCKPLICK